MFLNYMTRLKRCSDTKLSFSATCEGVFRRRSSLD
jgi:hypothetical protein